jgi:hypothetical protein
MLRVLVMFQVVRALPKATRAHWTSKVSTRAIGAAHSPVGGWLEEWVCDGLAATLARVLALFCNRHAGRVNCLAAALHTATVGHARAFTSTASRTRTSCMHRRTVPKICHEGKSLRGGTRGLRGILNFFVLARRRSGLRCGGGLRGGGIRCTRAALHRALAALHA